MDKREERGLVIAAMVKLTGTELGWIVPSQSSPDKKYIVDPQRKTCTCPDHKETGFTCKHVHAVIYTMKREYNTDGTVTETTTLTLFDKVSYKQNWSTYNRAQAEEKDRLQVLLADLCCKVPESEYCGTGRRPCPIRDRIFACAFKVYSGVSSRRFACDLNSAHEKGFLSRPLHHNKVNCYLEEKDLTQPLYDLVARSSLPMQVIEKDFAVDSTGISTSRHVRWVDEKYGVKRTGKDWIKVHICTGVQSNIVTAIKVTHRDVNDCPLLPELATTTAQNFKIRDMSADKGYLSTANVEHIASLGATPFIAPKSTTTGGAGGLFEKMYHFFQYNRDEFMNRYHKRSNVESTFSAVKRKFGDNVRSRTDTAMVNECLCKFLCHNLTVVIQAQVELGIEAQFWGPCANLPPSQASGFMG